jgi:uncharacterized RDD family membrane protein YckC
VSTGPDGTVSTGPDGTVSASPQPAAWVSSQGHYAGSVSRFTAYVIDLVVSTGLFSLGLAATSLAVQVVTRHQVSWNRTNVAVAVVYVAWEFLYFGYSWAVSGRTFGMAVLGVQVVRADGQVVDPWRGAVRALVFPLSFLLLGLGFFGILLQREHRALHDLIAGTAVIYAWDARAARLRFLARQSDIGAMGSPAGREDTGPAADEPLSGREDTGPAADEPLSSVTETSATGEALSARYGDRGLRVRLLSSTGCHRH